MRWLLVAPKTLSLMLRPFERKDRGREAGPLLRDTKSCVYTLIVFLPEPAWAARQYRDKQTIST